MFKAITAVNNIQEKYFDFSTLYSYHKIKYMFSFHFFGQDIGRFYRSVTTIYIFPLARNQLQ